MQAILDYVMGLSNLNKGLLVVFVALLVFYAYKWYTTPDMSAQPPAGGVPPQMRQLPEEGAGAEGFAENNTGDNTLVCTMYYTDWCKFCKKAKPEWSQLEKEFHGKNVNGKKILITKINCDDEPEIAEREQIQGYPTFKFNLKGKYYDYPDDPTFEKFRVFIEYLVGLN